MIKPFTCPDCGQTFELKYVPNRLRCPECAKIHAKLIDKEGELRRRERKKMSLPPKSKTPNADAEQDERLRKQMEQCRTCGYLFRDGTVKFCDYISWMGHSRDHGTGPGDCRSYIPREKITNEQRKARQKSGANRSDWW